MGNVAKDYGAKLVNEVKTQIIHFSNQGMEQAMVVSGSLVLKAR